MMKEQSAMLLELQQLGLTMDDLREYLDTHLFDDFAIDRFDKAARLYQKKRDDYVAACGPLSQQCPVKEHESWQWAQSNFPWDD